MGTFSSVLTSPKAVLVSVQFRVMLESVKIVKKHGPRKESTSLESCYGTLCGKSVGHIVMSGRIL